MDWMMEDGYGNRRKRHNIDKSGVVGHLDLPGGTLPEESEESGTLKPHYNFNKNRTKIPPLAAYFALNSRPGLSQELSFGS